MSKVVLPTLLALAVASMAAQADMENSNGFYVGGGANTLKLRADDEDIQSLNLKNGIVQIGYKFSENFSIEAQHSTSLQSESAVELNENIDLTAYVKSDLASLGTLSNAQIADVKSIKVNAKANANISIDASAIYATYRTSGNLYAKVKGGPVSILATSKPKAKVTWIKDVAATVSPIIASYLQTAESDFNDAFYDSFNESSGGEQSERETKFSVGIGAGYKVHQNISVELEYVKMGEDIATTSLTANYYF